MQIISREDLRSVLEGWQNGSLRPRDVQAWAEERYLVPDFEPEDEVTDEILAHLDILDINLTTLEDVPVFLKMLSLPLENTHEAIALLAQHGEATDIKERMRKYA